MDEEVLVTMARRGRTSGMRFTETFLLPVFGPANVRSDRVRSEVTALQRARGEGIEEELVRVIGADGRSYLVQRDHDEAQGPASAPGGAATGPVDDPDGTGPAVT